MAYEKSYWDESYDLEYWMQPNLPRRKWHLADWERPEWRSGTGIYDFQGINFSVSMQQEVQKSTAVASLTHCPSFSHEVTCAKYSIIS